MSATKKKYTIRKAPFIIIFLSFVLWIAGVAVDEPRRVLAQAVQICLSCIGIG